MLICDYQKNGVGKLKGLHLGRTTVSLGQISYQTFSIERYNAQEVPESF